MQSWASFVLAAVVRQWPIRTERLGRKHSHRSAAPELKPLQQLVAKAVSRLYTIVIRTDRQTNRSRQPIRARAWLRQ